MCRVIRASAGPGVKRGLELRIYCEGVDHKKTGHPKAAGPDRDAVTYLVCVAGASLVTGVCAAAGETGA